MAEEVLVARPLTDVMITAGKSFVDALRKSGERLTAAFWMADSQHLGWQLVLSGDDISDELFKDYFRILSKAPGIPGLYWPSLVRIEPSNRSIIRAIRNAVRSTYGVQHSGYATVNVLSTSPGPQQLFIYQI